MVRFVEKAAFICPARSYSANVVGFYIILQIGEIRYLELILSFSASNPGNLRPRLCLHFVQRQNAETLSL